MRVLAVIGIILAAFLLLSLVRVGGSLSYTADGLVIRLRLGAFRFTLFPLKKKEKRPPKPEKSKHKEKPRKEQLTEPAATGGRLDLAKQFLFLLAEAAGKCKRKVRIDDLDVVLTVATTDPAATAVAFGGANAAFGMLVPLLENHFNVKRRRFRTAVDFDRERPTITIWAAFSLTIGQGAVLSVSMGYQALKILMDHRKRQATKQKEAVMNGKESSNQ